MCSSFDQMENLRSRNAMVSCNELCGRVVGELSRWVAVNRHSNILIRWILKNWFAKKIDSYVLFWSGPYPETVLWGILISSSLSLVRAHLQSRHPSVFAFAQPPSLIRVKEVRTTLGVEIRFEEMCTLYPIWSSCDLVGCHLVNLYVI